MTAATVRWLAGAALGRLRDRSCQREGRKSHAPAAPNTYRCSRRCGARPPAPVSTPRLKRQVVDDVTREAPGTIVIDTPNTYFFLVLGDRKALGYGIGVGREGFSWSGVETISRMAECWYPPAQMIARQPYLPRFMAGGPGNPLGARALYLGNSEYRNIAFTGLGIGSQAAASGSPMRTSLTFTAGSAKAPGWWCCRRRAPAPVASASLRSDSGSAFGSH